MKVKKRAQIWGIDLMSGMVLFIVGVVILFIYSLNQSDEVQDNLELLFYEGKIVADNLLSSGYPSNWDTGNVITMGISDNNKINETKLEKLYKMIYIDNNYTITKNLLNTQYDYYFFLNQNMTINSTEVEGIGNPGVTINNINAKNLIKITRFTIYKNKTTPLYIYIWQK